MVHVFQGPGFLEYRIFWVWVQGPRPGAGSRFYNLDNLIDFAVTREILLK